MKTTKQQYARTCNITGEGMNEGFVFGDGLFYCKYQKDAIEEIRKDLRENENLFGDNTPENFETLTDEQVIELSHENDYHYYTEWEEEEEEL